MSRCRPITSAISRTGTPSSATACSEEACGVEAMHCGPAVGAVVDVAGDAPVARDADEGCHEAVVAVAVHGRRQPQDRRADAAFGEREREFSGLPACARAFWVRSSAAWIVPVALGR
jgi:hypothetical protein